MTGKETTEEVCGKAGPEQAKKEELRAAFLAGAQWWKGKKMGYEQWNEDAATIRAEANRRY